MDWLENPPASLARIRYVVGQGINNIHDKHRSTTLVARGCLRPRTAQAEILPLELDRFH